MILITGFQPPLENNSSSLWNTRKGSGCYVLKYIHLSSYKVNVSHVIRKQTRFWGKNNLFHCVLIMLHSTILVQYLDHIAAPFFSSINGLRKTKIIIKKTKPVRWPHDTFRTWITLLAAFRYKEFYLTAFVFGSISSSSGAKRRSLFEGTTTYHGNILSLRKALHGRISRDRKSKKHRLTV